MISCMIGDNRFNLSDSSIDKTQLKKWADKNILICPACGEPYEYCHGVVKLPYFRHKNKEECVDSYSESETQEHIKGKLDIYKWLLTQKQVSEVILEGWLPQTKQRPDIMFKYKGVQHIIEYQCTPISSEYYERHNLYKSSGIIDIWICGATKYFQKYHNGSGNKRLNILEEITRKYYDPNTECMYFIDCKLDTKNKKFEKEKENYEEIKNESLSYYTYTHRKSRRKGWITESVYTYNKSYATYYPLSKLKLGGN